MSQQPQQEQQQSFSDYLNNKYGATSSAQFTTVVPTADDTAAVRTSASIVSDPSDLFKRRLSEVAWSHSMEVSEEKRYKMANKRR